MCFVIIPSILCSGKTPLAEMAPQHITDPPPNFTVGTRHSLLYISPTFLLLKVRRWAPNTSTLVSSVNKTRLHCLSYQFKCFFANSRRILIFAFLSRGFLHATRPFMLKLCNDRRTVDKETFPFIARFTSSVRRGKVFRRSLLESKCSLSLIRHFLLFWFFNFSFANESPLTKFINSKFNCVNTSTNSKSNLTKRFCFFPLL